jgi:hypothetical protein
MLMRRLLICPSERSPVPFLSQAQPLATLPLLGQSLLEYWLSALAVEGVGEVHLLAHDRPEHVQEIVGNGERWGLQATVTNESRELTPAEALLKYASQLEGVPAQQAIAVLDHFPGLPAHLVFTSYQSWFTALCRWMPCALTPDRVGVNETDPGVWKGCRSHVSPKAQLRAPCWIGQHVFIGAQAVVGPGAIVEDGSFVEPGAEVVRSWIGPDTFVGQFARITSSLAWANTLVDWRTGSTTQLADPFLLSAVRQPRRRRTLGWFRKLSDVYARNKGEVGLLSKHLLIHKEG